MRVRKDSKLAVSRAEMCIDKQKLSNKIACVKFELRETLGLQGIV